MKLSDLMRPNQLFGFLAKGLEGGKVILANILIARYFSPEYFGKYSFVVALISLVAVVAEFRLQSVVSKELAQHPKRTASIIGSAMAANSMFALLGFTIVLLYASSSEADPSVAWALVIYSGIFLYKIPRALRSYFVTIEKNAFVAKCEALSSVATMLAIGLVIYVDGSVQLMMLARSLDFLVISLLLCFYYSRNAAGRAIGRLVVEFETVKSLVKDSLPLVASGAAMLMFQRLDILMVRGMLGDHHVGLYSSATSIMLLFSLPALVASETLAPRMFRSYQGAEWLTDKQKFSNLIVRFGLLLSVCMALLGGLIVKFSFGAAYASSVPAVLILSACPLLVALGAASGQVIVAERTQKQTFIKSILACAITLLSNWLLIPPFGITGAAISTTAGLLFANYLSHLVIPIYRSIFLMQSKSFAFQSPRFSE
jgi:O-antigen/teichoic acid export membrane protein